LGHKKQPQIQNSVDYKATKFPRKPEIRCFDGELLASIFRKFNEEQSHIIRTKHTSVIGVEYLDNMNEIEEIDNSDNIDSGENIDSGDNIDTKNTSTSKNNTYWIKPKFGVPVHPYFILKSQVLSTPISQTNYSPLSIAFVATR
jgi:hypothetical protein